jgi:hypothetical protein
LQILDSNVRNYDFPSYTQNIATDLVDNTARGSYLDNYFFINILGHFMNRYILVARDTEDKVILFHGDHIQTLIEQSKKHAGRYYLSTRFYILEIENEARLT